MTGTQTRPHGSGRDGHLMAEVLLAGVAGHIPPPGRAARETDLALLAWAAVARDGRA